MGKADYLSLGDYNALCYQCGRKRKASQMEKNWQGYYVCPEHNEPRQTQDFVRGVPDRMQVPWAQPVPGIVYNYTNVTLPAIRIGDGFVSSQYQFGSGLGAGAVTYNVTSVYMSGVLQSWTVDANGVVDIGPVIVTGPVTASGTETVVSTN